MHCRQNYINYTDMVRDLAHIYRKCKRVNIEIIEGCNHYSPKEIYNCLEFARRIERCIEFMPEIERFIVYNEVVEFKSGNWYLGHMTSSTYYRQRKKAYEMIMQELQHSMEEN